MPWRRRQPSPPTLRVSPVAFAAAAWWANMLGDNPSTKDQANKIDDFRILLALEIIAEMNRQLAELPPPADDEVLLFIRTSPAPTDILAFALWVMELSWPEGGHQITMSIRKDGFTSQIDYE